MIYDAREFARMRSALWALSTVAWVFIALQSDSPDYCLVPGATASWQLLLTANPPSALIRGWALMLVAMMAPSLTPALYHIQLGSLARRRVRALLSYLIGYGAVWALAGVAILALQTVARRYAAHSYLPATLFGVVALVWQVSPLKQTCLNRCHRHRPFSAFGFAADWDLLVNGLEQGLWCVGSCWAYMMFAGLLPEGHLVAMMFGTLLIFCERLDLPETPSWRWRGFGAAFRYLNLRWRGPSRTPATISATDG